MLTFVEFLYIFMLSRNLHVYVPLCFDSADFRWMEKSHASLLKFPLKSTLGQDGSKLWSMMWSDEFDLFDCEEN